MFILPFDRAAKIDKILCIRPGNHFPEDLREPSDFFQRAICGRTIEIGNSTVLLSFHFGKEVGAIY